MLVLGLWFVFQLWRGGTSFASPEEGGGVAFFAHIGGFVFGMLAVQLFASATAHTEVPMTFEEHVQAALDSLPPELAAAL